MTWLDISVNKWIDIYDYLEEGDIKTVICILYDIEFDELEDLPYEYVIELEKGIEFLAKPIPKINKDILEIDNNDLYLLDFNKLEFGAFIDLEYYFTKERNWFKSLPNILQILFRRKLKDETLWEAAQYELYSNYSAKRKSLFEDILFVDIYGSVSKYLEFRERLFTTYEGMFNEKENLNEVDTTKMTAEERKEIEQEKRISKWGYELLLLKLSNNDPLKIGEAMELPLTRSFNLLAMMYELKIGS